MKNRLCYQTSEYDCGPTTLTNAMRYLYVRDQVTPDVLKAISLYTLDAYSDSGETGKSGTSAMAMKFLSNWFNQYGKTNRFPIYTEFIEKEQVTVTKNSRICSCIEQDGVVVTKVMLLGYPHYVLLTRSKVEVIGLFDPYELPKAYFDGMSGICVVKNQPRILNRYVRRERMNTENNEDYSLGKLKEREAMLIYNTKTRLSPEESIEYFI